MIRRNSLSVDNNIYGLPQPNSCREIPADKNG